jgi:CRP-like cAMP-binding protein
MPQETLTSKLYNLIAQYHMLTPDEVQLIVDKSVIRQFPKGKYLLKEGQIADCCYLVVEGCVRQYILKDGEEKTTAFYTEGEPVNSFTSATGKSKSNYYLVCMEDCTLTVGGDSLEAEMSKLIPRLESIIRQEVERYSGIYQDELSKFITHSAEERYLDLMKQKPDLLQRVPQHQIASFIGVTPESLSRIRKRMVGKK